MWFCPKPGCQLVHQREKLAGLNLCQLFLKQNKDYACSNGDQRHELVTFRQSGAKSTNLLWLDGFFTLITQRLHAGKKISNRYLGGRYFKQSLAVIWQTAFLTISNLTEPFTWTSIFVNSVKRAQADRGNNIYFIKSTLLQNIPEAHCSRETAVWVWPRVNDRSLEMSLTLRSG